MTSGSINVNERGGGGQQRSYFMWIFKLYENGVYKSYLNRQTCDKNTLTHPHSKYTQVQHSTKTTMKTTTYKKLYSGFLCHVRYIGLVSRLSRLRCSQLRRHIGYDFDLTPYFDCWLMTLDPISFVHPSVCWSVTLELKT